MEIINKITILGCGSSWGVPVIGCSCSVCLSDNPKNKRSRVSIFVEIDGVNILIDTSPDFRVQALQNNIKRVDAVLYTHDHADHTHGIDDLRAYNALQKSDIPIYSNKKTLDILREKFAYVFRTDNAMQKGWYRPALIPNEIEEGKAFSVNGVEVLPFLQSHGMSGETIGFRIGDFAYSTDVKELDEAAFAALAGVDLWIVDCLSYNEMPTHAHLDLTLSWIERVKPKRAILTHMSHDFDYEKFKKELPIGVEPAYDGMTI